MSVLVLGTAQWGSDYGITNRSGRPSDAQLSEIFEEAKSAGLLRLDTAPRYGDAQARIRPWAGEFAITTKVSGNLLPSLVAQVTSSMDDLGVARLDAVLVHDWEDLSGHAKRAAAVGLEQLRTAGIVNRIGVSVYEESGVASASQTFDGLNIVQIPANVLDRRLDNSALIRDLHASGTTFQVRSALLQGLLASKSETQQGRHPKVVAFHEAFGAVAMEVALAHVRSLGWADEIVLGVTSGTEVAKAVEAWTLLPPESAPLRFACTDLSLIDPRSWPKPVETRHSK